MKKIETSSYLSIQRRLDEDSPWSEISRFSPETSVDYARKLMSMTEPVLPTAEHRLVYTKITTEREVLEP